MTEHTPGPWEYKYPNLVMTSDGFVIARLDMTEWAEIDARFIVTACNCHAELLETLKKIAKGEGACSPIPLKHASNVINNMMRIANEAVAHVKECER